MKIAFICGAVYPWIKGGALVKRFTLPESSCPSLLRRISTLWTVRCFNTFRVSALKPIRCSGVHKIEDGIILKYDASGRIVGVEILFLSKQRKLPDEIKDKVGKVVEDFISIVRAIA